MTSRRCQAAALAHSRRSPRVRDRATRSQLETDWPRARAAVWWSATRSHGRWPGPGGGLKLRNAPQAESAQRRRTDRCRPLTWVRGRRAPERPNRLRALARSGGRSAEAPRPSGAPRRCPRAIAAAPAAEVPSPLDRRAGSLAADKRLPGTLDRIARRRCPPTSAGDPHGRSSIARGWGCGGGGLDRTNQQPRPQDGPGRAGRASGDLRDLGHLAAHVPTGGRLGQFWRPLDIHQAGATISVASGGPEASRHDDADQA